MLIFLIVYMLYSLGLIYKYNTRCLLVHNSDCAQKLYTKALQDTFTLYKANSAYAVTVTDIKPNLCLRFIFAYFCFCVFTLEK